MCYCNGYRGLAVADYLIEKAIADNKPITNMSVLKMIFFAQGFGFPDLGRRLIKDDFYAWDWGPVEVNTYKKFRKYGGNPIAGISHAADDELSDIKSHPEIVAFLDKIYKLIDINPFKLSEVTHKSGSPWSQTEPYRKIDVDIIRNYYIGGKWKE